MKVSELMRSPAVAVPPSTPLREVARRMDECGVGSVVVVEGDALHGIVTDRDLALRGLLRGSGPDLPVEAVMSQQVVTVAVGDDVRTAYQVFRKSGVRRLPVTDGRRAVGVLTVDDLFMDVFQRFADLLGPVAWSVLEEPPGPPTAAPDRTTQGGGPSGLRVKPRDGDFRSPSGPAPSAE